MQQPAEQNTLSAPTFWQIVWGAVLGNIGCLLLYFLLICFVIGLLAFSGPQIGNIFSRITNGLNAGAP